MTPVLLILVATWHASPAAYNWHTDGLGAGLSWSRGSDTITLEGGVYDNSDWRRSDFLAATWSTGHRWRWGFTAGYVNGYPCGHVLPMAMLDAGYTRGRFTSWISVAPRTALSPAFVTYTLQVSL